MIYWVERPLGVFLKGYLLYYTFYSQFAFVSKYDIS